MSDSKLFQRVKAIELKQELQAALQKDGKQHQKKKLVMKKVIANMTMGLDLSSLGIELVSCLGYDNLELKKMTYLVLVAMATASKIDWTIVANELENDVASRDPIRRALAIRAMGYLKVGATTAAAFGSSSSSSHDRDAQGDKSASTSQRRMLDSLRHGLKDQDPYVRKTAALAVIKVFSGDKALAEKEGWIDTLREMLADKNHAVVTNAIAALTEISARSDSIRLSLNLTISTRMVTLLPDCSDWGQVFILESLLNFVPQESSDAEILAEKISVRLQHANSAIVLTSVKIILYLMNYIASEQIIDQLSKRLSAPLITLISQPPEIQYVALRNILLIIQKRPLVLKDDVRVFFCKYDDPIYVKLAKLEIMVRLTNDENTSAVLEELCEYATEIDVDFTRKAVRAVGRVAIKSKDSSVVTKCIETLVELLATKVSYVIQEVIIASRDILRKFPERHEALLGKIIEHVNEAEDPDCRAAMVWIVGEFAQHIDHPDEILDEYLQNYLEEPTDVQMTLLTSTIKLFLVRPTLGQELVPRVLKWATEEIGNPDLRDRGFLYWRLLSTDPAAAREIVLGGKPALDTDLESMDPSLLDSLLLTVGSLASIYHKQPGTFIRGAKSRTLPFSNALVRSEPHWQIEEQLQMASGQFHRDSNLLDDDIAFSPLREQPMMTTDEIARASFEQNTANPYASFEMIRMAGFNDEDDDVKQSETLI